MGQEQLGSESKRIAKNTIFLYFRMMFTMIVSLFTSRIILQKLGVDDYGIYQAVGGIVGFLSFVNGALATGSSRFLTFALGENNLDKLKRTFATTLNVHIIIAVFVIIIAETAGLWFLYNKMVIAPERFDAALYVYQLSILTAVFTLTQVPYNATIIAHERMSVFAYVSIFEVSAKLAVCYMLSLGNFDKLKFYATLLLIVQVGLMVFYRIYCRRNFEEAHFSFSFDKKIFKEIASFSGWSMFASTSTALNSQGILLLLNMFFTPAVVTARAISLQVNMAASQFVNNFRTAVNPQIVKRLAAGDVEGSHNLLLTSTKYSYFMMLCLCLPICLMAYPLLHLWLGIVPEYTTIFLQLIIIQSLFQVFDTSFYTALYAMGRLRENALISPTLGLIRFPIVYLLFKNGFSPVALSWASLITYMILGLIIKPILLIRIAKYTVSDIYSVFRPCLFVTVASAPIPIYLAQTLDCTMLGNFVFCVVVSVLIIMVAVYALGMNQKERGRILSYVTKRIKINGKNK